MEWTVFRTTSNVSLNQLQQSKEKSGGGTILYTNSYF
jgi:hypothetical protein